jgi:anaerobic ribonucleoside-triphosphate reductase activating protein
MRMQLHAFEPASRANGPGLRAVIWFQGCSLRCPGCFNPSTHDFDGGREADTDELVEIILGLRDTIEGVSISGGEPFEQPEALLMLASAAKKHNLSVLVFSGFTLEQIRSRPLAAEILGCVDVLIAGPYVQSRHVGRGLIGSSNQQIHLLSSRHAERDFGSLPNCEMILHADGSITLSGIMKQSVLGE